MAHPKGDAVDIGQRLREYGVRRCAAAAGKSATHLSKVARGEAPLTEPVIEALVPVLELSSAERLQLYRDAQLLPPEMTAALLSSPELLEVVHALLSRPASVAKLHAKLTT